MLDNRTVSSTESEETRLIDRHATQKLITELIKTVMSLHEQARNISAPHSGGTIGAERLQAMREANMDHLDAKALDQTITDLMGEMDYLQSEIRMHRARTDVATEREGKSRSRNGP